MSIEKKEDDVIELKVTLTPDEFQAMNGVATEGSMEAASQILGKCYDRVLNILKFYVDLPEHEAKIISIWIIGTYFHSEFNTYPFLFLNAMRGSGKTRLLRLINFLSCKGNGKVTNSITEAVLFRHLKNVIMCIDEIESIGKKENATLRELLNSAYKKGMQVQRMRKTKIEGQEQQVAETFEPFFPIALANIWGLEEVLQDRAITLILEKSINPAIVKLIEDWDTREPITELKRTLNQVSVVCAVKLCKKNLISGWNDYISSRYNYTTYINIINNTNYTNNTKTDNEEFFVKLDNAGIVGRNFELFFPLLVTSQLICNELFEEILVIAKNMVDAKRDDEYNDSKDVSLYQFVAEHGDSKSFVPIKAFTEHFRLFAGNTESTDEAWCNDRWVGRALKRLNLIIQKRRLGNGVQVMVDVEKAKEKIKIFK